MPTTKITFDVIPAYTAWITARLNRDIAVNGLWRKDNELRKFLNLLHYCVFENMTVISIIMLGYGFCIVCLNFCTKLKGCNIRSYLLNGLPVAAGMT